MHKNSVFEQLALWNPHCTQSKEIFASGKELGAVYTRRETVDFILDLTGYTPDKPLHKFTLLEPSFGNGDFLIQAVERLLISYLRINRQDTAEDGLRNAITAIEIDSESAEVAVRRLSDLLSEHGFNESQICSLLGAWLRNDDFLLAEIHSRFDFVVGNPPYVRQELIPDWLMVEYRSRYETIYDRADLYIPFIERSLRLLKDGAVLGFICSDRWMKNRYGGPLRALIAGGYHLKYYVDMVETQAFLSDVTAYPAIFVISRERSGKTRIAHRPKVEVPVLDALSSALVDGTSFADVPVVEVPNVVNGREPWILDSLDQLNIVRRLEVTFPLLEEVGCKVGIGVATGADKAFIGKFDEMDVEPCRKLPLVTTKDIVSGSVKWHGLGVVNPFNDDGTLVDLDMFPRLKSYFEARREIIAARNCARRNPHSWYRTIDRIYPELAKEKKLLIPDIKGEANVVFEPGQYYPHHNLYYIISSEWDLRALQVVLRSGIARLFVGAYSTQMRGGYLRYQAQYLRRIRLPRWNEVPRELREKLIEAARKGDAEVCNRITFELYGLNAEERAALGGNGN
ncbi:MAG TPA: Eco57I restriction-modification methylase domain-containing protein [Geobacteraceae bacterium]|nr:Eco57I restriction-modification methylase domain-containing protein [Geobacteraceae bacterium]